MPNFREKIGHNAGSPAAPVIATRRAVRSLAALTVIAGLGLALGACSKCDVPVWQPRPSGPQSCHDGPAP
jgi:hypothetical protein